MTNMQADVEQVESETLNTRPRAELLHWALGLAKLPNRTLLWSAVGSLTCFGSGNSYRICRELGWNPDMTLGEWRKAN